MNEPVYDDPKAQRWIQLYQKRARILGQLPESDVLIKTELPADHWFWKEDNVIPSEGFAVNINLPISVTESALGPFDLNIIALDDFGHRVRRLPIKKTGSRFWFGTDQIFDSGIVADKAKIEDYVWPALLIMRNLDENSSNTYLEDDSPTTNFSELTLRRITWEKSMNAWLFVLCDNRGSGEIKFEC